MGAALAAMVGLIAERKEKSEAATAGSTDFASAPQVMVCDVVTKALVGDERQKPEQQHRCDPADEDVQDLPCRARCL